MNIKKAIAERLLANNNITEIVGTRIYRGRLPETLKPPHIIVWQLPGHERIYDHDGYAGITKSNILVACYSEEVDQADDLADLVIADLEAWAAESEIVGPVFLEDRQDDFGETVRVHGVPLNFRIIYNES